jgi:Ni/Co efflux regulator RcnB
VRRNFVKTLLLTLLAGAVLAAPMAGARDWRQGQGPRMQGQGQPVKKGPQHPVRRDGDKRAEHDKRPPNRLTDQERHDLRRDVDRADREIYRR